MTDAQKIGAEIAYRIRAELVCCHVYEELEYARQHMSDKEFSELLFTRHDICYWGEAAARLAEEHHLQTPEGNSSKV